MVYSAEEYESAVDEIARSCNLPPLGPCSQDWEFEVADASKLNILIRNYKHLATSKLKREVLAHLLIGSFNDAITIGTDTDDIWSEIEALLLQDFHELEDTFKYWACIDDLPDDRFKVSGHVIAFCERAKQEKL